LADEAGGRAANAGMPMTGRKPTIVLNPRRYSAV
jgi:hypothetical protein